jgi:hypothetical protein
MTDRFTDSFPGILALFNDVAPGSEGDYETWFQTEHLAERLSVPGFLIGRRHEAVSGSPRYFNYYVTQSADVLKSDAYLARLGDPTPMTRKVMSAVFKNMNRTVCRRTHRAGTMAGVAVITVRFTRKADEAQLKSAADALVRDIAVACAEVWMAVSPSEFPVSEEERLRGGDRKIESCILVETLRVQDAERIAGDLSRDFAEAEIGVYRRLCELRSSN